MLLIKKISVYLNIVHFKFKQVITESFQRQGLSLTPEQFIVLDSLWDEGPMSQQALADFMGKDKNSVTKLLDALENKGMLRRIKTKGDRRVNIIEVTDQANSIKELATCVAVSSVKALLKGISDSDLEKVVEVFDKIDNNIVEIEKAIKDCR